MSYFGIDFSLTATGIASFDGTTWDTATIRTKPVDKSPGAFLDRVDTITTKVLEWCDPQDGDVFAIETPALRAKGAAVDRMFYGYWAMHRAIRAAHDDPWCLTPGQVKKLATGSGTADKDEVLINTVRRLPDAPARNNNESDAVWLAVGASYLDGQPILTLPNQHIGNLLKGTP